MKAELKELASATKSVIGLELQSIRIRYDGALIKHATDTGIKRGTITPDQVQHLKNTVPAIRELSATDLEQDSGDTISAAYRDVATVQERAQSRDLIVAAGHATYEMTLRLFEKVRQDERTRWQKAVGALFKRK